MQLHFQKNSFPESLSHFDSLPSEAFVRLPVVKLLYACSSATIWRGVKQGRIPAPIKLSPRTACWNVGDLRQALRNVSGKGD
jgi:predicted DNA-binding transcriptional regulator AlpA